jgi:hypothetical protein
VRRRPAARGIEPEEVRRSLGPDHADRDDRRAGAEGETNEAAAAEAGQPVPVSEELPHPLDPLREDADDLLAGEEAFGVLGAGADLSHAAKPRLEERERREHVEDQHPRLATRRVLEAEARLDHGAVPREDAGWFATRRAARFGTFSRPVASRHRPCRESKRGHHVAPRLVKPKSSEERARCRRVPGSIARGDLRSGSPGKTRRLAEKRVLAVVRILQEGRRAP